MSIEFRESQRCTDLFWVVRCGDHDSDALAVEFLGSERGEKSHSKENAVEDIRSVQTYDQREHWRRGRGTTDVVRKPAVP